VGKVYSEIDEQQAAWMERQHLFFVATAPLGEDGHVNVSPKGPGGTLRVLDERTVAYLDVTGSGAETIAHLRENRRIVVMLCAFSGPPRILRLHGTGEVVDEDDERFASLVAGQPSIGPPESTRSVIVVDVERIADSCGYGVPLMSVEGEREHYALSAAKRLRVGGPTALAERRAEVNGRSIDGLPALDEA
jgi:hypothetical protein